MSAHKRFSVFKNASVLLFLQIASYIVPFLLLPYLSRTLGLEGFGSLAALWSVGAYAQILIDFGFFLWAAKECAALRDDRLSLSTLISSVLIIKFTLSLFALLFMSAFAYATSASMTLYVFMWLSLLFQALMPVWFFQGMQKVTPLLIFSLAAQFFGALLTILLVKSSDDLAFVAVSSAAAWGLFSAWANIYVYKKFSLFLTIPSLAQLKAAIEGARHMFVTNVAVAVYANLPAFILSIFGAKGDIAVFAGAQKIISAISGLFAPISSALLPKIVELTKNNVKYADEFIKKAVLATLLCMGFLSICIVAFADFIVKTALGEGFEEAALLLKVMAVGPIFVSLSTLIYSGFVAVRNLAPKMKGFYSRLALFAIFSAPVAVFAAKQYGAATLYVCIEAAVFFGLVSKIIKWRKNGALE